MTHCLQNLQRCYRLAKRPSFIPVSRPRGTKALGLRFERRVGALLRRQFHEVHSGEWFEFVDAKRQGVCQIDHYIVLHSHIILCECKLSEAEAAWPQMKDLYAPILERHYGLPVARVQIVRHLRTGRKLIDNLFAAQPNGEYLCHLLV